MRSREEILKDLGRIEIVWGEGDKAIPFLNDRAAMERGFRLVVELLLDIRDAVTPSRYPKCPDCGRDSGFGHPDGCRYKDTW